MRSIAVAGITLVGLLTQAAFAQTPCSADRLTDLQRLSGNTVCGRPAAGYPGGETSPDRWQEQHHSNFDLIDYKRGPTDKVDPTKKVGTWSLARNGTATATITYTYEGGSSHTYGVYVFGPAVLSFCRSGIEIARAGVKTGLTSCSEGDYPP